jgi:hypothetical protein
MGDFGSATEAMRIIDLFALQVFAKNLDRCNFRLLQHYLPIAAVGQRLLYHLVGALLDRQRHVDAKCLGGLEVHHEFKLDWLFDR